MQRHSKTNGALMAWQSLSMLLFIATISLSACRQQQTNVSKPKAAVKPTSPRARSYNADLTPSATAVAPSTASTANIPATNTLPTKAVAQPQPTTAAAVAPSPATVPEAATVITALGLESGPVAAKPLAAGSHLFVIEDGQLKSMDKTGRTLAILQAPGTKSCSVDKTHDVVWLMSPSTLRAYDLQSQQIIDVASGEMGDSASWGIQRGDRYGDRWSPNLSAGTIDGRDDCVSLVVRISAKPRVSGVYTGVGHRHSEGHCGELDDNDKVKALEEPYRKELANYDKVKLQASPYLLKLYERARKMTKKRGAKARPEKVPPPPKGAVNGDLGVRLKVDSSNCEDMPEDCGALTYTGGGRVWQVEVANSQGCVGIHNEFQFYDAKTARYWDPLTDERSATPFKDKKYLVKWQDIDVAPDKTWGVFEGKVLSLTKVDVVASIKAEICGWAP